MSFTDDEITDTEKLVRYATRQLAALVASGSTNTALMSQLQSIVKDGTDRLQQLASPAGTIGIALYDDPSV